MKRMLFALFAMSALALGGCQTASDLATDITSVTATVQQKAKEVQSYAVRTCSYVPTVASIVAIFNSGYSNAISTVGTAICNAVTTIPLADGPGDHKPRVNGVIVRGKFVK